MERKRKRKITKNGIYHSADATQPSSSKNNFIQRAIKHPGALHKQLHVKQGEKIPLKKLKAAEKKGGLIAKRAHFAETLRKINKKRHKK